MEQPGETMAERKARLKALRQAKEAAEGGAPAEETKDGGEEPPVLKFRNYLPKDEVLGEAVMKATKAPEFEPVEAKPLAVAEEVSRKTVGVFLAHRVPASPSRRHPSPETGSAEDLGTANPNPPSLTPQDDIYDLLPKRENIDLKNHVERKMQKLERKTQRAMIELMQAEEDRRMRERGEEAD